MCQIEGLSILQIKSFFSLYTTTTTTTTTKSSKVSFIYTKYNFVSKSFVICTAQDVIHHYTHCSGTKKLPNKTPLIVQKYILDRAKRWDPSSSTSKHAEVLHIPPSLFVYRQHPSATQGRSSRRDGQTCWHSHLYDSKCRDYRDTHNTQNFWREIREEVWLSQTDMMSCLRVWPLETGINIFVLDAIAQIVKPSLFQLFTVSDFNQTEPLKLL